MAAREAPQLRSLYRRFLRELPSRNPSILANPSPVQRHVRSTFLNADSQSSTPSASSSVTASSPPLAEAAGAGTVESRLAAAEQYISYLRAQRLYITLVERYNPGTNMNEEQRVKLTARRVGMDLPEELAPFVKGGSGGGGSGKP